MIDAGLSFRKDVVQVAESETAFTTFELLDSKRLSGIAVVDEDGKLIGYFDPGVSPLGNDFSKILDTPKP